MSWPPTTQPAESEQRHDLAGLDALGNGRLPDRRRPLEREGLFGREPDLGAPEQSATGAASGLRARWIVRTGVPHKEIVAAAARERADVIVLGTQGRGGIDRALLGSVADRVIRLAPCPVLTVRETD